MNQLCGLINKQRHISIRWSTIQKYFDLSLVSFSEVRVLDH